MRETVQGRSDGGARQPPALIRCLKALETGDTLIVWKLDRLGRSLRDLIHMLDEFKQRGIKFRSLTEAIDTETPTGRAMWQMIGVLAELERSLIVERTRAGVKAAQKRAVKFGRKPKLTADGLTHARKLIEQGTTPTEAAKIMGVGRAPFTPRCSAKRDSLIGLLTSAHIFPGSRNSLDLVGRF